MEINKIAVCGAGTMGSAIAQHFCMKGLSVLLFDLKSTALEKAKSTIHSSLNEAKDRKIITEEALQKALANLTLTTEIKELASCQLVVEAVFEDRDIKKNLFKSLEDIVSSDCILASNTSSFLVTDLGKDLKHPERFAGVHYFYHAAKNKLVEIIAGKKTNPLIIDKLEVFYRNTDKIPIRVKDAPGFAVNRFFVPWLNEATRLYEEGRGSIAFIDEVACKVFQIGMGPFGLMNATGVPIAMHAAQGLADVLGTFYAPSEILKKQVAQGTPWDLSDNKVLTDGKNDEKIITERLLAASVGIATLMVNEEVADAASVDLGARVGLRWAKGPFELIKERGQEESSVTLKKWLSTWSLAEPKFPKKLDWIRTEIIKDCAFLVFDIPDRMNALSEDVVESLEDNWNRIENNNSIKKIFFLGRGKAFVAGADINFFIDSIDKKDFARIKTFTERGQKLLNRFSSSTKTTIAYLNGLTLGGGLELALSCHYRVASTKASLAFPETGIGIYPGLGGTQRTTRLIGKGLAKYLVATGAMLDAQKALRYGLIDKIIPPVKTLEELTNITDIHSQSGKEKNLPEENFLNFKGHLDDSSFAEPILKENEKLLRRKAPIALKLAMQLIDEGENLSLSEGLNLELKHLDEIFKTKDARAGLGSVISKTRPEFLGQ